MFNRFASGLRKTRQAISNTLSDFSALLGKGNQLDQAALDELEEALILADIGAASAADIVAAIKKITDIDDPQKALADIIKNRFGSNKGKAIAPIAGPYVILIVGVNGSGKTTTIAKIAGREIGMGHKVLLAAADTFRAAAGEQLEHWADKVGADIIRQSSGSDPAAVAFDAVKAGISRSADLVLIDTAGRLQTKTNLMEELKKIKRVVDKALPGAPHEILMVMDATTGQNGLSQIDLFHQAVGLTGIVVTKLDGSAKGGVLVAAAEKFSIPIKYVGLGEKAEDLVDFDPAAFSRALVGIDE